MTRLWPTLIGLALVGCGGGVTVDAVPVAFTTLAERGYCAQTEAITVCREDFTDPGPAIVRQDFDCGEDTSVVIGLLRSEGATAALDAGDESAGLKTVAGRRGLRAFAFAVGGDPPAIVIGDQRFAVRSVEDICEEHVSETGFDGTEGFETLESSG